MISNQTAETHPVFCSIAIPFSCGAWKIYVPDEWRNKQATPEQRQLLDAAQRLSTVAFCGVYKFTDQLAEALGIR